MRPLDPALPVDSNKMNGSNPISGAAPTLGVRILECGVVPWRLVNVRVDARSGTGSEPAPRSSAHLGHDGRHADVCRTAPARRRRLRGLHEAIVERVTGTADGADQIGGAAAVEGFAQAADVDVDGALSM